MVSETQTNEFRSWLMRSAGEPYLYLTTIGRRTGQAHRIEIWFAVHEGKLYLMAGGRDRADWVRNLHANPRVSVELGDETHAGEGHVVASDSLDDRLARDLLVTKYAKPGNDLAEWGRNSLPVVVEFPESAEQENDR